MGAMPHASQRVANIADRIVVAGAFTTAARLRGWTGEGPNSTLAVFVDLQLNRANDGDALADIRPRSTAVVVGLRGREADGVDGAAALHGLARLQ